MKKINSLNEQLDRIKNLIDFKFVDNSNEVISEQGTMDIQPTAGISGSRRPKKAAQEDIQSMEYDKFKDEIKRVAKEGVPSMKLTDDQAEDLSMGIIKRAQVKGSEMNKKFIRGLVNNTLNIKKDSLLLAKVKLGVSDLVASDVVNGVSIVNKEDDTSIPKILVYDSDGKTILESFDTGEEIVNWLIEKNIESFLKEEEQYYLTTFRRVGDDKVKYVKNGLFMVVRGEVPNDGITFVSLKEDGGKEGEVIPGKTDVIYTPIDLEINMGQAFVTDKTNFKNYEEAKNLLLGEIKNVLREKDLTDLIIDDILVISSASNYYGGYVDPTHNVDGTKLKDLDFNSKPKTTNDNNVDKNNLLAWNRGLRILSLLDDINNSNLEEPYGVVKINDEVTKTTEWRITDTGGSVDEPGHEGKGQYAKIFIKGRAVKEKPINTEPIPTPGKNQANLRQSIMYVDGDKPDSGIRFFTSLFGEKAKIVRRNGKVGLRRGNTFSGFPKWIENIFGSI